ncbi:MAG: hypothetical protein Q7R47_02490 [Candidatus Diapherotrites archaeon]|nr:hypothetical protein [Candidatus Diapherotrites archaeon]
MTPSEQVVYLTAVHYVEAERLMVCVFENGSHKEIFKSKFFPHLLTSASEADIPLVLSPAVSRNWWCEDATSVRRVFASSFSFLRQIQLLLETTLDSKVLMVPVEIQFLLSMKWRLFGRFEWVLDEPRPLGGLELPFVSVGFLSNNLHAELSELVSQDESAADSLCDSIIWSNILRVSPEQVPAKMQARSESFLQNLFFEHDFLPCEKQSAPGKTSAVSQVPLSWFENTAEFDFSKSLFELSLPSGFNLGFETVDCACCAPADAAASNLLPHALVRVRILSDGFFFQSVFSDFAMSFHARHPESQSRMAYQNEFGFSVPPVGPLFAGMLVEVPLADAHWLEAQGHGVIAGLSLARWVCLRKNSFWSESLSQLLALRSDSLRRRASAESTALSQTGLGGLAVLSRHPGFLFEDRVSQVSHAFSKQLLLDALDPKSGFFSSSFGAALEACRELVMNRFFEFNRQKGLRVIVPHQSFSVFVQSDAARQLASEFSRAQNLPAPALSQWHFQTP